MKVYLFIALFTPIIEYIENKVDNSTILIGLGYFIIFIFSLLAKFTSKCILIQEYVIYAVQYSIVALMGLRFVKHKQSGIILGIISFIVFGSCLIFNGSFEPSLFKYPPEIYYISYGLLWSVILYYVVNHLKKYMAFGNNLIRWLSSHSFSIYICHIYYLWLFFVLGKLEIRLNFVFEFFIIIFASITQVIILEKLKKDFSNKYVK